MSKLCVASIVFAFWTAQSGIALAETLSDTDVLREASAKNPSVAQAAAQLQAAHALTTEESARYDAVLKVTVSGTHTKTPSLTPGASSSLVGTNDVGDADANLSKTLPWGTQIYGEVEANASRSSNPFVVGSASGTTPLVLAVGPGYLFSAKAGVTQPLLRNSGRMVTMAPYYQATAAEDASKRDRDLEASIVTRDVLTAYWELWYAARAVDVDRLARDTAKAQRDDAAARMKTGSLSRADVLTFETQLATKEETVLQTELERASRQNDLARLLGRETAATDLQVSDTEPPQPDDIPGELTEKALTSAPEVASKQAAITVAQVKERTAADQYRPRLDLDAYVQAQGLGNKDIPSAFSQLAGFGVLSAHIGLTLELPVTSTRRENEAARARAQADAARFDLEATRKDVASNVATARSKRDLARRRIDLAQKTTTFANDELAAQQALFKSGSGTALQVVQAQDNVQAANKQLARARADLIQSHLTLSHLTGTLVKRNPS